MKKILSGLWARHWLLVTSIITIVAIIAGYWITQAWREYVGNRRLQAAMAVAAADMADWQWGPGFEVGPMAEKDNVARDITEWMLQRGLTEYVRPSGRTGWIAGYETWEAQFFKDETTWAEERQLACHPYRRMSEKLATDLTAFFAREDARVDLGLLRQWVDRPAGRYEYRVQGLMLLHLLPMVQKIREVTNMIAWDAQWQSEQGSGDLALLDVRMIAMLARSFGDDPIIICQLVRMAVGNVGVKRLERVLAQAEKLDAKQLALLQAEYWAEAERPILLAMARGGRAATDHDMALLQTDAEAREKLVTSWAMTNRAPKTNFAWLDPMVQKIWQKFLLFPSQAAWPTERAIQLEYQNAYVNLAKQPENEWLQACQRLPMIAQQSDFLNLWIGATSVGNTYPGGIEKMIKALLSYRSMLRCGAAACAAERFRMEKGRWPSGWAELVPGYLPSVPMDGMTQQPLLWKSLSDGIVIYSVGRDGKDDGGDVLESANGQPKDLGIRLWSVSQRRQKGEEKGTRGQGDKGIKEKEKRSGGEEGKD